MNRSSRRLGMLIVVVIVACLYPAVTPAIDAPVEPQTENAEFTLDVWTNRYDRYWREVWDGGDNRYRLRFGSNNVREWFLEEEVKLAASLVPDRFRLRFYHSRFRHDSSDHRDRDTVELEWRLFGKQYVSFFASLTFDKAENSCGFVFQSRKAVDTYAKFIVELPHTVRNFAERHGDRSVDQYVVFTDKPVRLALDARGDLSDQVWSHIVIDYVHWFETATESEDTGCLSDREGGGMVSAGGWIEYARGDRGLEQIAIGVNYLASRQEKKQSRYAAAVKKSLLPTLPRQDTLGPRGIPVGVGNDFYDPTEPDSVTRWTDEHMFVEPYVWVPVNERWAVKASVRLDHRETMWRYDNSPGKNIQNRSFVAGTGAQVKLGEKRRSVLESGLAMEYRERREKATTVRSAFAAKTTDFHDHRLYVSYEYRFNPTRIIRLIETIDFDREDWGSFSIHDHAFVQMVFSF